MGVNVKAKCVTNTQQFQPQGLFPKRVVESQFSDSEGSESVGFSHGDFGLVVEALDYPAGEQLLGLEVVEDEIAVRAEAMTIRRDWERLALLRINGFDYAESRPKRSVICVPFAMVNFSVGDRPIAGEMRMGAGSSLGKS